MQLLAKPVEKVSVLFLGERTAHKRGLIPTAVAGTGAEVAMKAVDNIVGSPVQRIFSFNLPIVGTVGAIDVINFLMFSNGVRNIKSGLTAVIGSKIFQGALTSLGPIRLPGAGTTTPTGAPSNPISGTTGASF